MENEKQEKRIQDLRKTLEEKHKRTFTQEETEKTYRDMETLAGICLEAAKEKIENEKLLKENPKGFLWTREGGTCAICNEPIGDGDAWYDKFGLKCMTCQNAINKKIVPGSVAKERDSWYSEYDLAKLFNINRKELNKYVKGGYLIERIILTKENKAHLRLFLIKDNKSVLPPKGLLKGKIVQVDHNGEKYFTTAEWYDAIDAKRLKKLAKYAIINCFPETFSKPLVAGGRFLWKSLSPLFITED